jgi:hypothetical protein
MDRGEVDRWLAGYVEAWRTYDRERIAALFSADAKYRYHPYDGWVRGRDAIVSSWLGESDSDRPRRTPGNLLGTGPPRTPRVLAERSPEAPETPVG